MTNFEKFKNMTVKELASEFERLSNYVCDYYSCKKCPFNCLSNRACSATGFADWLESEADNK